MTGGVFGHFVQQWIHDTDCFFGLHDRKLCVLGLVYLMQIPDNQSVADHAKQLVPSSLLLFGGLKRVYAARNEDDCIKKCACHGHDEEIDSNVLDSDEDEIDDEGHANLESNQEKCCDGPGFNVKASIENEESCCNTDDDYDGCEQTYSLDAYTTPLDEDDCPVDEYNIFKDVLFAIQGSNPAWYSQLTDHLTTVQGKALEEVISLANKRLAAKNSKQIEHTGGYQFTQTTVPGAFNFGGSTITPFRKQL